MTVVVNTPEDFTLANYRRASFGGEAVQVGSGARQAMDKARAVLSAFGKESRPPAPSHARTGAVGGFGGFELEEAVVRGIVFARLADLVSGLAPIRPEVADRVAGLLERPLPKVPLDGQVGAGETLTLAEVLKGVDRGDLDEAENMAVFGGSPCAAALAADAAIRARHRLVQAEAIFALSIEAFRAPLGAYDAALEGLFGDVHEAAALRSLRSYLKGVDLDDRRFHQAPVSYRIIPRVLGQARRSVAVVEKAASVSLRSVTLEEVSLPPDHACPDGRTVKSAGSHNAMAYPALNALSAAWADLALVGERQVTALNTTETSDLPLNLAVPDVPRSGTYAYGWAASGFVEEARAAAAPALLPGAGSGPYDDILTPTFPAHRRERRAAECLDGALTILALVSSQALFVTDREPPAGLRQVLARVRSLFPPIVAVGVRDLSAEAAELQRSLGEGVVNGGFFQADPSDSAADSGDDDAIKELSQ